LNADVNAFERLQIVLDRNSSYFGSKYYVVDNIMQSIFGPAARETKVCAAKIQGRAGGLKMGWAEPLRGGRDNLRANQGLLAALPCPRVDDIEPVSLDGSDLPGIRSNESAETQLPIIQSLLSQGLTMR
jgi:hypothetical protein